MKRVEGSILHGKTNLSYAAISHKGQVRTLNEDAFLIMPEHSLFCIADGMGGYQKGEVASSLTIEAIGDFIESLNEKKNNDTLDPSSQPEQFDKWLEKAIRFANQQLTLKAAGEKMGSTIVIGHFSGNSLEIGHVGDSRAYRLRNGLLQPLTEDHSLVNALFKMGSITREEMSNHPQKNVITQALGPEGNVAPDIIKTDIFPNDIYLFCSDGLTGMLEDSQITEIILAQENISKALDRLLFAANKAGGKDNITAILVAVG